MLFIESLGPVYNWLECQGEMDPYGFYRNEVKRVMNNYEARFKTLFDGQLASLFDVESDRMLDVMKSRRSITREVCMMTTEEVQTVNLVLKAVEQNKTNHKRIDNFVKKLMEYVLVNR